MARKTASRARPRASSASSTGGISADAGLAQAQKTAPYFKKLLTDMHAHMQESSSSTREADYQGHHVVIETSYKITVDGKPFNAGLGVTDGGRVYYHGMPNVGFDSAVDLMKAVITRFADEFTGSGEQGHDGHTGDHDHEDGGHDHGMMMPARRTTKKANKARPRAAKRVRR
jgi:hypothetical protein